MMIRALQETNIADGMKKILLQKFYNWQAPWEDVLIKDSTAEPVSNVTKLKMTYNHWLSDHNLPIHFCMSVSMPATKLKIAHLIFPLCTIELFCP